jgi:hypothetical protein
MNTKKESISSKDAHLRKRKTELLITKEINPLEVNQT